MRSTWIGVRARTSSSLTLRCVEKQQQQYIVLVCSRGVSIAGLAASCLSRACMAECGRHGDQVGAQHLGHEPVLVAVCVADQFHGVSTAAVAGPLHQPYVRRSRDVFLLPGALGRWSSVV